MAGPITKFINTAQIDDAQIRFRNFSGNPGQYNAQGQRNFCVLLPDDIAEVMKGDGWNIKYLKAREEGDKEQAYIKVKVNFAGPRPPKIWMITSRGRRQLDEDMVSILDWADFAKVDLIMSPYKYDVNGNQGVSAYLQTIFVTIREDELEQRYADVPEVEMGQDLNAGWEETSDAEIDYLKQLEIES